MTTGVKKCTLLLLSIVLLLSMGSAAFAADDFETPSSPADIMGVQWANIDSFKVDLSFEGSNGYCSARVIGKSGTTRIIGKVVLARKNINGTYTTIKTWNNLDVFDDSLFDETYYVSLGYTYRLTATATVYRNGTAETVTGYAEDYAS